MRPEENYRQNLEKLLEEAYTRLTEYDRLIGLDTEPTRQGGYKLSQEQTRQEIERLEKQLEALPAPATARYFRYDYLRLDSQADLIGRENDLKRLGELLQNGGCVAITAVGGQGKTSLAYAYLKPYLDGPGRFEALVWQTIRGDGTDLGGLAEKMGIAAATRPDETSEMIRQQLGASSRLMVLDNLEAALKSDGALTVDLEPLLFRLARFQGQSQVIITTREIPPAYRPAKVLALEGLRAEAGAALLAERGLEAEPLERRLEAARRAHGHPFALQQLAELATDPFGGNNLENLLQQSELWDRRLAERLLALVWETRLSAAEQSLLEVFAVLRPPVRRETLGALLPALNLGETLGRLADRALLTAEYDLKDPRKLLGYDLHPLLRRFVLTERLTPAEAKTRHTQAAAYFQTLIPTLPSYANYGRKAVAEVWPILEAVYHLNRAGDYSTAYNLFFAENLHEDLSRWGEAVLRIEIYRAWLGPADSHQWRDRSSEGVILGNLGLAYSDLGQVEEAVKYYQQTLLIAREIGDKGVECICVGNLGLAYAALERLEEALECYSGAISIARQIGKIPIVASQLDHFGAAYEKLDDLPKAFGYWRRALDLFTRLKFPQAKRPQASLDRQREKLGEEEYNRLWAESEAEYRRLKQEYP